jgi:hypothetical protein
MPLDRAGIRHRLHALVFGAERRRPAFGLGAHRAEGVAPDNAKIAGGGNDDFEGTRVTMGATQDG